MRRRYTPRDGERPVLPDVPQNPAMAALLARSVLYHDDHVLVINKPAGLAVHPGPRTPESLELYLDVLMLDRKKPPQPAHRLDRDTSGCLVLGRTLGAVRQLSAQFSERLVKKTYLALVEGFVPEEQGTVDAPLLKISSEAGGWRMIVDERGQKAVTRWQREAVLENNSQLLLSPETGRTHQLRVHCAHMGFPIVGDPVYGNAIIGGRTLLHAQTIEFPDNRGGTIRVTAPLPDDWPVEP
jgi:tRNA pseudouridine32 synthase / 23S rRNA pseudouridine746 synthase